MDGYRSAAKQSFTEFTERRSVFYGFAAPVRNEDEAVAFVNAIRSKYPDATHNVYAYVLRENNTARFSDDGEPHGTAGLPVLDVIRKTGLTDVAVVVTRYFGGILLGAGGLVRAYTASAKAALDAAGTVMYKPRNIFTVSVGYNEYGKVSYWFRTAGIVVESVAYGENVTATAVCPAGSESVAAVREKISELSAGRFTFECDESAVSFRPDEA